METVVQTQFVNDWLGLILDGILIVGVFCLWLTWLRNGKRQQKMEQLLMDTAQQLEEATMHLSLASNAIEALKKKQDTPPAPAAAIVKKPAQKKSPFAPAKALEPTSSLPPQNSTQATMILRMQREGESEESIADRLNIPLAQVKLMLKLHAASSSAEL